jgi:hypothetical protein
MARGGSGTGEREPSPQRLSASESTAIPRFPLSMAPHSRGIVRYHNQSNSCGRAFCASNFRRGVEFWQHFPRSVPAPSVCGGLTEAAYNIANTRNIRSLRRSRMLMAINASFVMKTSCTKTLRQLLRSTLSQINDLAVCLPSIDRRTKKGAFRPAVCMR